MEFIDLKSRLAMMRGSIDDRIAAVLDHGRYILGPEVAELEETLAEYVGVKHCVGVASGTDSLLIALMALKIGPGDEVITVPYTWISSAEVIALTGATPVFVDIEEGTWNMDPQLLEAVITEHTKAIMPVGIYGQVPDMGPINKIAERYGIPVIEDAAQSFGATYYGKKSCSLSLIGSTSFFPSKPLGGFGDGGALFTNDEDIADAFRKIRVHGQAKKHHHPILGLNGRLDTLQAAMILAAFSHFSDEVAKRQKIANKYNELFREADISGLRLQKVGENFTSVYAQYTILTEGRDSLNARLKKAGVPTVAYYARPLHLQPVFGHLKYKTGDFPVTEFISEKCLSLPMSAYLGESDQIAVVESIINETQ